MTATRIITAAILLTTLAPTTPEAHARERETCNNHERRDEGDYVRCLYWCPSGFEVVETLPAGSFCPYSIER